jgi:hypothetical protein
LIIAGASLRGIPTGDQKKQREQPKAAAFWDSPSLAAMKYHDRSTAENNAPAAEMFRGTRSHSIDPVMPRVLVPSSHTDARDSGDQFLPRSTCSKCSTVGKGS